jgi:hypothetical protein
VKFHSNAGWILTPRECRVIAAALRNATLQDVGDAFYAYDDNVRGLRAWQDDDPDAPPELVETLVKHMGPAPTDEEYIEGILMSYPGARGLHVQRRRLSRRARVLAPDAAASDLVVIPGDLLSAVVPTLREPDPWSPP